MRYLLLIALMFAIGCSKKNTQIELIDNSSKIREEVILERVFEHEKEVIEEKKEDVVQEVQPVYTPIDITVYFDFDSDVLRKDVIQKLCLLANTMRPNTRLLLTGACCPIGESIYNYRLGLRRANAVYKCLEFYLDNSVKMECASYGEDNLVKTNRDEFYLNRRVIIKEEAN